VHQMQVVLVIFLFNDSAFLQLLQMKSGVRNICHNMNSPINDVQSTFCFGTCANV